MSSGSLKDFAQAQLDLVNMVSPGHSLTIGLLTDKYAMQSGRCGISGLKLRFESGFFDSAMLRKIDPKEFFTTENIQFVSAGVHVLYESGLDLSGIWKMAIAINKTLDRFCPPKAMGDPMTQASIHSEYILDTVGFKTTRISRHAFGVAESDDTVCLAVNVMGTDETPPFIQITAMDSALSGSRMFTWLTDNGGNWTASTTVTGAATGCSSTTSFWNKPIKISGNKFVNAPCFSFSSNMNTGIWNTSTSSFATTSASSEDPAQKMDREMYRESSNITISLADPKLFEKVEKHIRNLLEAGRKFKPIG